MLFALNLIQPVSIMSQTLPSCQFIDSVAYVIDYCSQRYPDEQIGVKLDVALRTTYCVIRYAVFCDDAVLLNVRVGRVIIISLCIRKNVILVCIKCVCDLSLICAF